MAQADGSIVFEVDIDNKEAQSQLNALEKSIGKAEKNIEKMESDRGGLEEKFQRAASAADEAGQRLKAMRAQLKEAQHAIDPRSGLGFEDISLDKYMQYKDIAASLPEKIAQQEKEYNQLIAQADKLNGKLADYDDKISAATAELTRQKAEAGELVGSVSEAGSAYQKTAEDAQKAADAVEDIAESQQKVGDTEPISRAAMAYEKLKGILERIPNPKEIAQKVSGAVKERFARKGEPASASQPVVDEQSVSRSAAAYSKMQGILGKVKAAAGGLGQTLGKVGSAAGSILSKVAQGAKAVGSALAKIGKAALSAFAGAAKAAAGFLSRMNVFSRVAQRLSGTFKRLGGIIKGAFIFNVISQGLTALRGQISSYLSTNAAFTAALNNLKGTLAGAFQPILNVAVPALITLINVISQVIATIGRFIGALFSIGGRSKANTKALNAQSAAIGGAGAAAEEAAKSLASFDEINRLAADSGGGGGGGGGGGADVLPEYDFESDFSSWGEAFDAFLDTIINEGIPRLRAAFSQFADWMEDVSTKLYEMFTFPGVKEKVHIIGTELADAFNDLIEDMPWEMMGKALGAGLNLALILATDFIYGFNWINLGKGIATLVNNAISEIEWENVGRLLWAGFKIGLETFAGFLVGLEMPEVAKAASDIVIGFFDSIKDTAEKIPWKEIGENIAEFFTKLDWKGMFESVYEAVSTALKGIRDLFVGFLSGLGEWTKPLVDIINTISSAIEEVMDITKKWVSNLDFGPISTAFTSLGDAVSHLVEVISNGLVWAYENVLLPLAGWIIEDAAPVLVEALAAAVDFLAAVLERLQPVALFIWENVLKPLAAFTWSVISSALELITSLLQKLTDLLSGNTTFSDFINSLSPAEAILLGVATALGVVFTAFAVMEVVSTIGAIISGAITAIGVALNFLISPIGIVILAITGLVAGFVYLWQTSEGFREFWTGVWEGFCDIVEKAVDGILGFFKGIGDAFGSLWDWITGKQDDSRNKIEKGVDETCDKLDSKTTKTWDSMETAVSGSLGLMETAVDKSTDKMDKSVTAKWDHMLDYTKISWEDIDSVTDQVWQNMEKNNAQKFEAMSSKVRENWEKADEDSKAKWNAIDGVLSGIWGGMEASSELRFNGVKNNITDAWERANTSTDTNFTSMQNKVDGSFDAMSLTTDKSTANINRIMNDALKAANTNTDKGMSQLQKTTDSKSKSAVTAVNTNFGKMKKTVVDNMNNAKTAAQQQDWTGVGRNIVDGMSAGVNERAKQLANAVANAAYGAFNAAKAALQVNSPSKKTEWLFKMVMDGGVLGVKENAYKLINVMKRLSEQVMDAFQPNISIPSVPMPAFEGDFTIPRLATGAVIPPNREFLAVLGDQRSGNNIEAPEGLIRKIVREESGGGNTELLQAILEAIREGQVIMVDRQVLGKTVTRAQNRMTRASGRTALLT